jgi:hypothetical protein
MYNTINVIIALNKHVNLDHCNCILDLKNYSFWKEDERQPLKKKTKYVL